MNKQEFIKALPCAEAIQRIADSMCSTCRFEGGVAVPRVEGRISEADFHEIIKALAQQLDEPVADDAMVERGLSCEVSPWKEIDKAKRLHQKEMLGYDPDIGVYNMHWRDDKNSWCFTWNQEPCRPTHYAPIPLPPFPIKQDIQRIGSDLAIAAMKEGK